MASSEMTDRLKSTLVQGGLYYSALYAMRGAARATWSTIKRIPGIENINKEWKTTYERENGK